MDLSSLALNHRWDYGHGVATIQVVKGTDVNFVERLWNGQRQTWWTISTHSAFEGMADRVLEGMVRDEEHLHQSHVRRIGC